MHVNQEKQVYKMRKHIDKSKKHAGIQEKKNQSKTEQTIRTE